MKSAWMLGLAATLTFAVVAPARATEPSVAHIEELITNGKSAEIAVLRERIWNTPLGLLVSDYIQSAEDPARLTQRVHQISTRVYASVNLTGARLTALSILFEDLFERGSVDQRVLLRIGQLQTEIGLKGHVTERRSTGHAMRLIPLFMVLGALSGSPLVREQTAAVFETAFRRLGLERKLEPTYKLRVFEPGFAKTVRREFGTEYSVIRAGKVAAGSWASVAAVDYVFHNGADDDSRLEDLFISYLRESQAGLEDL